MINSTKKKVATMLYNTFRFFASWIMHITRTIAFLTITTIGMLHAGMPGLNFDNLSPEEEAALMQEFERMAKEVEQAFNAMSPEEQEAFVQQVEELDRTMRSMSPEEQEQFIAEMIAQEMERAGQQPEVVRPAQPIQQPKVEVSPEQQKPSEKEPILILLNSIIQNTDKFIIKSNNIPDISLRVNRWLAGNKIQASPQASWETIKNDIESFKQKLHTLKDVDSKTNKYRLLPYLIKNEALSASLASLEAVLSAQEPNVSVSSFGIEELNSQSKRAIKEILSAYHATITAANAEITKLFEEYAPEAQKLKEEEQKRTEQAHAAAAQPRTPKAPRVAGSPEQVDRYPKGGGGGYDYDYGYPHGGGGYSPSYGGGYPYQEEVNPKKETEKPGSAGAGGGKGGTEKPKADAGKKDKGKSKKDKKEEKKKKEEEEKKKKEKEEKDKKDKEKKQGKPEEKKGEPEVPGKKPTTPGQAPAKPASQALCPLTDPQSPASIMQLIKNNLDQLTMLLQESKKITNIQAELMSSSTPDMQLALVTLPGLDRRIKRLDDLVKQYLAKTGHSDAAKKELRTLLDKHNALKAVSLQLKDIKTKLDTDEIVVDKIPATKQYAYLAIEPLMQEDADTTKLDEVKTTVPHPTSLIAIANTLAAIDNQLHINEKPVPKKQVQEPQLQKQQSEKEEEKEEKMGFDPFKNENEPIDTPVYKPKTTLE